MSVKSTTSRQTNQPTSKTIKSIKLHKGQVKLLKHLEENSQCMYHTIVCSRQFGKSVFMMQLMLDCSINNPNSVTMFISPTYQQSKRVYKNIKKGIKDMNIIESEDKEDNSIVLKNGSVIYYKSAQLYENLRGYDVDYMFIDEFRDVKDEAFYGAFRPMLLVRGKKCFLISTPKGKNNALYKNYMLGLDKSETRYSSFRATYVDNPFANIDEVNDAHKALPERLFRQEYLAEFIDGNGDVFKNINNCCVLDSFRNPVAGEKYYAGIDIGKQDDYTVLTIFDGNGNVVYIYRMNKKPYNMIVSEMVNILRLYKPKCLVETNGVGGPVFDMLRLNYAVEAFNTSNTSKQMIIEELIVDMDEPNVKFPSDKVIPELKLELEDFTFDYSPKSRKIVYSARSGHDDLVMSLAIANHCRRVSKSSCKYGFA